MKDEIYNKIYEICQKVRGTLLKLYNDDNTLSGACCVASEMVLEECINAGLSGKEKHGVLKDNSKQFFNQFEHNWCIIEDYYVDVTASQFNKYGYTFDDIIIIQKDEMTEFLADNENPDVQIYCTNGDGLFIDSVGRKVFKVNGVAFSSENAEKHYKYYLNHREEIGNFRE